MSEVWNRTLVYLGLREEPEEMYDELPERFVPEDDPYAAHAPQRGGAGRDLVGAGTGAGAGRAAGGERGAATASIRRDEPRVVRDDESRTRREPAPAERGIPHDAVEVIDDDGGASNVRPLRLGDRTGDGPTASAARVAVVEVGRFDDVEAIGARYRTGQAVLFDVVGGGADVGRRVVDFVAGLTYASRGSLTKAGTRAFLLVPNDVVIGATERQRLRDLGYRVPVTDA
jgi:cell division inhibitor SepF